MLTFGWTIEYTLNLTFPIFFELFPLISRARADAAIDGVYAPYAAAKYGGKMRKSLVDARGGFYLSSSGRPAPECSKRQVTQSWKRLQAFIDAREAALAERAGSLPEPV